jgi:hypothetical protein
VTRFLAEIWASGQEKGRELLETREEQQLAKKQEMVTVNLPLSPAHAKWVVAMEWSDESREGRESGQ